MRKPISIATVVVLLCKIFASGCSLNPTKKLLHPGDTEFSSVIAQARTQGESEKLVALDLVAALVQISEMNPAQVLLQVNDLSNSFDMHVQNAINSAGYRQQSEDPSRQLLSVVTAINPTKGLTTVAPEGSAASVKTYQIKIRDIILKRDYLFDNGRIEPGSAMYVKGANATHVKLDKNIFDTPAMDDTKTGQHSTTHPLQADATVPGSPILQDLPPADANVQSSNVQSSSVQSSSVQSCAQLSNVKTDPPSMLPLDVRAGPEMGSSLSMGDPIRITVEVGQDSRIYCYYEDTAGNVTRLFPNRYQKNSMVYAGETLVLPQSNQWQLSASLTGETEHVMCIAAAPEEYAGIDTIPLLPDLLPIMAANLGEIHQRYEAAAGTELISRQISIIVN